jgi:hypothetical protein
MAKESKSQGWWQTAPGILTAVTGIITALTGLVVALHQMGVFERKDKPVSPPVPSPTTVSTWPTPAPSPTKPSTIEKAKVTAWQLGSKLGLAAALRAQGHEGEVNHFFGQCRVLAQELGLRELTIPEKTGEQTKDSAVILGYILQDTEGIAFQLTRKYSEQHAEIYALAAKSMLVAILYSPEDRSMNSSLAKGVEGAGKSSGIPQQLWTPLLDKMKGSLPYDDVKQELFEMHERVEQYLQQ